MNANGTKYTGVPEHTKQGESGGGEASDPAFHGEGNARRYCEDSPEIDSSSVAGGALRYHEGRVTCRNECCRTGVVQILQTD